MPIPRARAGSRTGSGLRVLAPSQAPRSRARPAVRNQPTSTSIPNRSWAMVKRAKTQAGPVKTAAQTRPPQPVRLIQMR